MNWWSLFSPANTIVGDGLSQASPNASHCLIFEDITVLDTTAKYSAQRILHHMQTGVLKYLKAHLRKTLNLPLTLQTVP